MRKMWAIKGMCVLILGGCNRIKIEEIPCPPTPHEFCGEQAKRLIDNEWKLDGWTINKSGFEGPRYSAYRAGKLIFSEGKPTHAKWFTQIKTNVFEIKVVERNGEENAIMIMNEDREVLYQLVFSNDSLKNVFRVPQDLNSKSDTLYQSK